MSTGIKPQRNALETYAMWVCFFAIVVFSYCFGSGVYHLMKYSMPDVLMTGYEYERFASNDGYCRQLTGDCFEGGRVDNARLAEEAITAKRETAQKIAITGVQHDSFVELIWAVVFAPIAAFVFAIHWRIGRKARESQKVVD
jgi:hypothetical protein